MATSATGKLADPAWRQERARKAALARTSLDHHLQQVVDNAPALTAGQLDQLRRLLPPVRDEGVVADDKAA